MPKTKEISLELKEDIGSSKSNKGSTAIVKHFMVSKTAVRCIIAKHKETNPILKQSCLWSKKLLKTLERKGVNKNPQISAKMIVVELDLMFHQSV